MLVGKKGGGKIFPFSKHSLAGLGKIVDLTDVDLVSFEQCSYATWFSATLIGGDLFLVLVLFMSVSLVIAQFSCIFLFLKSTCGLRYRCESVLLARNPFCTDLLVSFLQKAISVFLRYQIISNISHDQ